MRAHPAHFCCLIYNGCNMLYCFHTSVNPHESLGGGKEGISGGYLKFVGSFVQAKSSFYLPNLSNQFQ